MNYLLGLVCLLPFINAYIVYDSNDYQCKIEHGGWGKWQNYGPCSVSCGHGVQKQVRFCDYPVPKYGGNQCSGAHHRTVSCKADIECPHDGEWGPWEKGQCSTSCGYGVITYTRKCEKQKFCGKPCVGGKTKTESCHLKKCPIDGQWGEWKCENCKQDKGSMKCSRRCTRKCDSPAPAHGGKYCEGDNVEEKTCPHTNPACYGFPPRDVCKACEYRAVRDSKENGPPNFVGHACRIDKSVCNKLNGGIKDMYIANSWFFVHCSPDGPWCKPCATRKLVYNPNCGQCETTRHGPCTGPNKWQRDLDVDLDDDLW